MLNSVTNFCKAFLQLIVLFGCAYQNQAQDYKTYLLRTIAFYNVENLFDIEDDPFTFDDDRTPAGKDLWTQDKYEDKLKKLSFVISDIGKELAGMPPAIVGVCEIENFRVLEDLVNQQLLLEYDYGIIHYDSPDRRGIDVGLLYQKSKFIPHNS